MSLQTSRIPLLFFFLLILAACEKPSDIGLGLAGQHPIGTHYNNSRTITASTTVQADSILAFKSKPAIVLVGKATDGDLGQIAATHYSEVSLNSTSVNFNVDAATATADSLVLVLSYTGYYYGDTTSNMTIEVNNLDEQFLDDKTYYANTTLTKGNLLGSKTFKPAYNRVKKNVTVDGTTKSVAFSRLLHIPLNNTNLGTDLLRKSGSSDLASQDAFRKYLKGIIIGASAGNSIVGFNTSADSAGVGLGKVAGLNLYYKDKNGQRQRYNFSLSPNYYFNGITSVRSAPLNIKAGEEVAATQTANVTYFQENTGVKTRLTFPDLTALKNQGNIYINHAELILPVKDGTTEGNGKAFKAPSSILLYESTAGKRVSKTTGGVSLTVQQGTASPYGITRPNRAIFEADSNFYKANVTTYIQALLDGKKTNNGIIVSPQAEDLFTANAASLAFPSTVTTNRAQLDARKMVLRIYYSKVN